MSNCKTHYLWRRHKTDSVSIIIVVYLFTSTWSKYSSISFSPVTVSYFIFTFLIQSSPWEVSASNKSLPGLWETELFLDWLDKREPGGEIQKHPPVWFTWRFVCPGLANVEGLTLSVSCQSVARAVECCKPLERLFEQHVVTGVTETKTNADQKCHGTNWNELFVVQ